MGFDREQILVVELKDIKLRDSLLLIKNKVLQNSNVLGASLSNNLPSLIVPMMQARVEEGTLPDSQDRFGSYYTVVDQDFLDVYGIELISGRNFSEKYANETEEAVIINETVVRQLGWKEPLGKMYRTSWVATKGRVIGVIKDFHSLSLHQTIQPLTLMFHPKQHRYLSLKISPIDLNNTIAFVRETVESFNSDYPFTYFFLDDSFNKMYLEEKKLGTLFRNFSALAIFISCLGLLGLASFAVETRTKEVGIRKILGASLIGIFLLHIKEFTKWVLLANVIAWPVAYYGMNKWLQNFAYRSEIGLFVFILSGFIAMASALMMVSFQSIKAAAANPVDSLRYE
jgi:putative ABC transport system permease protein